MDDQRLAEQLRQTGNLLDTLNEDDWWEGDNWDGLTEAGVMAIPYVRYLESLTPEQHRFLRWRI